MAYDPEARETGNSAMIIGIVALVLVIGAVLAYYATRPDRDVDVVTSPAPTTIVEKQRDVPVPVPVPANPPVVVTTPAPTTRVEKSTTVTRDTTRVVPSGTSGASGGTRSGGDSQPKASTSTNVTINTAPPTTDGSATDSTDSATSKGTSGTAGGADTAGADTADTDAGSSSSKGY